MDQTSLRARFEQALSAEPPLGQIVGNSLRAGRRRRRRRRTTGAAALSAVAVVAIGVTPVITAGTRPHPATQFRPDAAGPGGEDRVAYVVTSASTVVPVSLATGKRGKAIRVPFGAAVSAATPDGRTIYVTGYSAVARIDAATGSAGRWIRLPQNTDPSGVLITPNGKTAYLNSSAGVLPLSTSTNRPGKLIRTGTQDAQMAVTPDGRTLYVLSMPNADQARTVVPVDLATGTALRPIRLGVSETTPNYLYSIAITPDGKTAYVADGVQGNAPYASSVVPISLATGTALRPIRLRASGLADDLVIAPDGRTAYVLTPHAVTPINTATDQAGPGINLPAADGSAYSVAITPDGQALYVLTPRGIVPVRTATRAVLPMTGIPRLDNLTVLAITPDGRTVYVGAGKGVVPVSTATNTAGRVISLGGLPFSIAFGR